VPVDPGGAVGATSCFASISQVVPLLQVNPNGQHNGPHLANGISKIVVLRAFEGNAVAFCCCISHVTGCILVQFPPVGQQRSVVLPASSIHDAPGGQQKDALILCRIRTARLPCEYITSRLGRHDQPHPHHHQFSNPKSSHLSANTARFLVVNLGLSLAGGPQVL
jgi:hypothetical protein